MKTDLAPRVQSVPLGELCRYQNGGTPSRANLSYWGGDIPWITSTEISSKGIAPARSSITQDGLRKSAATLVKAGTLLLVTRTGVGKIGIAPYDLAFSQDITAIFPDADRVDTRYLCRFLQTQVQYFDRASRGATIKGITRDALNRLEIPLPPVSEQRRIADILDKADAIRRKRREAETRFDELLKSTFIQMFGNPIRNPMGWDVEPLGVVATLDRGKSRHRPRDAKFLYDGPYPLVQTGDITNSNGFVRVYSQTYSEEGLAQSRLWPAGTLCITIAANIGKTAVLTFDACFPDSVVGLIAGEKLTIEYVRHWFVAMEKATDAAATQVAQKNINLDYLRKLNIQVPPMAKQHEFSSAVNKIRQARGNVEVAHNEASELFNSLVQRAFNGIL